MDVFRNANGHFLKGVKQVGLPNFGRPPLWESPEDMYKSYLEYMDWVEENKIKEQGIYGKDAVKCDVAKHRGSTIMGFCKFCETIPNVFYTYAKKDAFKDICSYIANSFTARNIDHAMAGVLNPSIVARVEGLVDKKQVDNNQVATVVYLHVPQIETPPVAEIEDAEDQKLIQDTSWDDL